MALKEIFTSKTKSVFKDPREGSAKEKYPDGELLFSNPSPQHLEREHERPLSEAADQQNTQKPICSGSTLFTDKSAP